MSIEGRVSSITTKPIVKFILTLFLIVASLLDSLHLLAQKSEVQFETLSQSIGDLAIEKDTLIQFEFCFFNKGKYPIKMRYQTSKAVSLVAYDRLITGKKKSCLKIAYKAVPDTGEFNEKILLYLENAIPQVALLNIQGHIHDKSKMYQCKKRKIFLDKESLQWKISQTDTLVTDKLKWLNQTQDNLQIKVVKAPPCLKPIPPVVLKPLASQIIEFTCDPLLVQEKGFSASRVVLEVQGKTTIQQEFMIITEYLIANQTVRQAPEITLERDTLRYNNSNNKYSLRLYNQGTGKLKIDNIVYSCGCLRAAIESNVILPKDSTLLHFEFSPQFNKNERINIYSNDPKKPVTSIYITEK